MLKASTAEEQGDATEVIPHRFIFTLDRNILEEEHWSPNDNKFYDNVLNTIESYRKLWKEQNVEVWFLNDTACEATIQRVKPDLLQYFRQEEQGKFRGDICRAAALYERGGYYFDIDLRVVAPVLLAEDVQFSTVRMPHHAEYFFQAYWAVTARHPILHETLNILLQYYKIQELPAHVAEERMKLLGWNERHWKDWRGPVSAKLAYNCLVTLADAHRYMILQESQLSEMPEKPQNVTKQNGEGCCCNYVVHSVNKEHPPEVHFFSRFVGGSSYCDYKKTPPTVEKRQSLPSYIKLVH